MPVTSLNNSNGSVFRIMYSLCLREVGTEGSHINQMTASLQGLKSVGYLVYSQLFLD